MNVAINGFGRIGRQVLRMAIDDPDAPEIVHINDIADAETLAHLLKYDTVYGVWNRDVSAKDGMLVIDDQEIPVTAEREPSRLPWRERSIDVVLESSGHFRKREQAQQHLDAGAKKVVISAPGKTPLDGDFVAGVNDDKYDPVTQHIVSVGSCTTNCLAPLAKVLHEEFTIVRGLLTTAHGYTSSQNLVDAPHKDLRRARAAAVNIIPTTTGAAQAIGLILPELDGKLDGMALRLPIASGSILDLTCELGKSVTVEEVNQTLQRWSDGPMKGVMEVAKVPLVSSDIVGNPHRCIVSPQDTRVMGGTMVKILAWYDNEWAFCRGALDMIRKML